MSTASLSQQSADLKIFVVFGMPRAGTTYLYHVLTEHPSLFVPYRKETHYFSANYGKGEGWFRELYKGKREDQLGADINPTYFVDEYAIPRILKFDSNVKVILGVRQPVDFAVSLYANLLEHGQVTESILKFVNKFEWKLSAHANVKFSLVNGFMETRIRELARSFGSSLFLYDFKEFEASPLAILQKIEQFLGIPSFYTERNTLKSRINASGRRDFLRINTLITNQALLESVYTLLPKTLVRKARLALEKINVRRQTTDSNAGKKQNVTPEERVKLTELLATDTEFYTRLFLNSAFLTGDRVNQYCPASVSH